MEKMDDTEKVLENNANSDINFDTSVLQEKNEPILLNGYLWDRFVYRSI